MFDAGRKTRTFATLIRSSAGCDSRARVHLLALLMLLAGGCGTVPVPAPIDDPPPIVAPPVTPPVQPPSTTGITMAAFDAVPLGATEADVVKALGAPFQSHDAAGFAIHTYLVVGDSRTAFAWMRAGVLDHKTVSP